MEGALADLAHALRERLAVIRDEESRRDHTALVISHFVYVWEAKEFQRHAGARGPAPGRRLLVDEPDPELVTACVSGVGRAGRECRSQQQ